MLAYVDFPLAVFGKVFQERMSWFADKKEAEEKKYQKLGVAEI